MHAQEKLQIGIDWTDDEWECTIQFTDFVNDYYVVNSYQLLILVLVWPAVGYDQPFHSKMFRKSIDHLFIDNV